MVCVHLTTINAVFTGTHRFAEIVCVTAFCYAGYRHAYVPSNSPALWFRRPQYCTHTPHFLIPFVACTLHNWIVLKITKSHKIMSQDTTFQGCITNCVAHGGYACSNPFFIFGCCLYQKTSFCFPAGLFVCLNQRHKKFQRGKVAIERLNPSVGVNGDDRKKKNHNAWTGRCWTGAAESSITIFQARVCVWRKHRKFRYNLNNNLQCIKHQAS